MLFNSLDFIIFFPVVVMIYYIMPQRIRSLWLLFSSYYFYMSWNPKYGILLAFSTIITYLCGILLEAIQSNLIRRAVLSVSVSSNLLVLVLFKYANFVLDTLARIMNMVDIHSIEKRIDILLPVGISFYTFQAIGYTIDVYRKKISAEKNIVKYSLFISFFPQLVAGPIERTETLLYQIKKIDKVKTVDIKQITEGIILMFWGFFQKLVIADRASIFVDRVYSNYQEYGLVEISLSSIMFAFQIYCDFGGYTNIARGAARVLGFDLMDNFRQPYFATSIKEFWRRWHISLTSWFTDYLYIPLGGNRKGEIRKYINIIVVFCLSGLWHGASWHYVAWGLIHGIYQICGDISGKFKKIIQTKYGLKTSNDNLISRRIRKGVSTFILVDFAWLFFAADSMKMAIEMLEQISVNVMTTSIFEIGLNKDNWKVLIISIFVLLIIDVLHENNISIIRLIESQEIWFRFSIYNMLIWSVLLFGVYGVGYDTSQFIYFQF